jgi:hypothetical protein
MVLTAYRMAERWAWFAAWLNLVLIVGFGAVATAHDGWGIGPWRDTAVPAGAAGHDRCAQRFAATSNLVKSRPGSGRSARPSAVLDLALTRALTRGTHRALTWAPGTPQRVARAAEFPDSGHAGRRAAE